MGDKPPTKAQRKKALQTVLYKYPVGATVTDPADIELLMTTLNQHRQRDAKIGVGVKSFQVEKNHPGSVGFWLTRIDGSRTDWSFIACLTPPTRESEIRSAFRTEVRQQIWDFHNTSFDTTPQRVCSITGETITRDASHVDHADLTFVMLVDQFILSEGVALETLAVTATIDGNIDTYLMDRSLAERWRVYHATHARLRVVSIQANLSVLKRKK